jgi:hypothetical protein
MGKTPGALRARDELGQAVVFGSVTPSQLGRPVACRATHGGFSSGCFAGYGREEKWNGLFIFQSFSKLQTNLNSNQIWISMTSTRTIKYKNTSQHHEKYASAWNATNKYLFKCINL